MNMQIREPALAAFGGAISAAAFKINPKAGAAIGLVAFTVNKLADTFFQATPYQELRQALYRYSTKKVAIFFQRISSGLVLLAVTKVSNFVIKNFLNMQPQSSIGTIGIGFLSILLGEFVSTEINKHQNKNYWFSSFFENA